MPISRPQEVRDLESRLIEGLNRQAIEVGEAPDFRVETDHLENVVVKYAGRDRRFCIDTELAEILLRPEREHQLAEIAGVFLGSEERPANDADARGQDGDAEAREADPAGWRREHLEQLRAALERERREPEAAAGDYAELLTTSQETRYDILAVAVVAPLFVAPIVFLATRPMAEGRGWMAFLILFFGGFYPPFLMASRWAACRRGALERMSDLQQLFLPMIVGVGFFFEKLAFLFSVGVYAVVIGLPWYLLTGAVFHLLSGSPWWAPPDVAIEAIAAGALVLAVLVALSDVDQRLVFEPRQAISELAVGLWHSRSWNVSLLANLAIGVALAGSGPLELLYHDLPVALGTLGIAGALHGLGLYRQSRDERLHCLTWIALARTEIRRRRLASARWRLRQIDTFSVKPPPVAGPLAHALIRLADPDERVRRRPAVGEGLDQAAAAARETGPHAQLWTASVDNSRALL